jgi:hypothetical protein
MKIFEEYDSEYEDFLNNMKIFEEFDEFGKISGYVF